MRLTTRDRIESYLYVIMCCIVVASFFTVSVTFLMAYLTDAKQVTIHIDESGEANFELMVIIMTYILLIYFTLRWFGLFEKKHTITK